ncbi:MAG: right-handed parallel beta-helix repeat-containing protein, partial [Clostridia bacterium]|nr:right-handed parallel beta-helix repeat-containing protein [Clostridia bacterium]
AAKLGIVTGNPDGSFNAKGSATRGEAAVMFSRLKKFLADTPLFTPAGEYSPVYDAIVYEGVDLNQMINDAYAAGQKEITIAPGAYRIKNQPRGGHIVLKDAKDFTINGEGVTLLLQTMGTSGISLSNCENVTVNGFNIDWEKPNVAQGQIYNIDPDGYYFDFTVEPGYPHDFAAGKMYSDGMTACFYDSETHNLVEGTSTVMLKATTQIEQLGPNTYRLNGKKFAGQPEIKVGDYFAARAYKMSAATAFSGCKDIKLTNVTVWSALSTLNDIHGEGNTLYENVRLDRGPKPLGTITPRMVSTQGDGVHTTGLRVGPKVINCVFAHQLDDGLNIHGPFAKVAGIEGNKVILGVGSESLFAPGDDLRFYNPTTEENSQMTLKSYEKLDSYEPKVNLTQAMGSATFRPARYIAVTLDGKKNFKVGDWVINRNTTSSGFEIRNSVFTNTRSRACLVKSSDGIIENCEFSYGAGYGLWIAPEFNWTEAGYSENIVVRNCTFFRNGWLNNECSAGLSVSGEAGQDHENITVENCTFYENYGTDIHMSDGIKYTIRNNTFKEGAVNADNTIEVWNATDVTISGNTFEGARKDKIKIADTVTNCKQS